MSVYCAGRALLTKIRVKRIFLVFEETHQTNISLETKFNGHFLIRQEKKGFYQLNSNKYVCIYSNCAGRDYLHLFKQKVKIWILFSFVLIQFYFEDHFQPYLLKFI